MPSRTTPGAQNAALHLLSFCVFALLGLGCSPSSSAPAGSGGASGGTASSGGQGVGGAAASGGAPGSGGTSSGGQASGGASGSGGGTATGGSMGSGGTGTGGSVGSGGDTGSGGALGSGGSSGGVGSAGCGKGTAGPSPTVQQTIQVGGLTRYYLLYVPEDADPDEPLPLIFGIHGLNMNNVWAAHDSSGFQLIEATAGQAILVYPQGIQANGQSNPPSSMSQWGTADSNWGGGPPNADEARLNADLAYFDAMIDVVSDDYCIDPSRTFAMGFSQGGFMTNALGCERASVFRALAPVAGWGPWGSAPSCGNASAQQAVIQTQGDTDGTVTPALGQATRDFWRERAGCTTTTMPSSFGSGCVEYQGCDAQSPIVYCTHGGDHFVPSGSGQRAWDFFQSLD
jgi:polyhydroxybutyrate depolymerase